MGSGDRPPGKSLEQCRMMPDTVDLGAIFMGSRREDGFSEHIAKTFFGSWKPSASEKIGW